MKKRTFYGEVAYLLGLALLALGTAFMARADLGLSMVVAPAYLLHLKIAQVYPFFTFGMAEYAFQALLLALLMLALRSFRVSCLFSFVTAVLYGLLLDLATPLAACLLLLSRAARLLSYAGGFLIGALGVSLLFHTDIPPEVYELAVKEISARGGWRVERVKAVYDLSSCLLAVALSFLFFGRLTGVGVGTVGCALLNGPLIGCCNRFLEKRFVFRPALPRRGR